MFILTTVSIGDHSIATDLLDLRRDLAWNGVGLRGEFHATEDKQLVRDAVFNVLQRHSFRIDATIVDKSKTQPHLRPTQERFYHYAWYYHMKYITPRIASISDELLMIAASVGIKKKRAAFHAAIKDVMDQVSPTKAMETAFWPAAVDPCLQVADYCSWAIQRKWESQDTRPYDLIKDKILTEYDLFRSGMTTYY